MSRIYPESAKSLFPSFGKFSTEEKISSKNNPSFD